MGKTIKARYKDEAIRLLETLDIPDNTEITITINNISKKQKKIKNHDWQELRGILEGTTALQDHEREHREEIECEKGS